MARHYKPSLGVSAVLPAFDASWELTTSADYRRLTQFKTLTAIASQTRTENVNNATLDRLCRAWVSDPLSVAGTFGGTVKGQMRCMESATAANMRAQLLIKVVSRDGLTVRGTAVVHNTTALSNEWNTALRNIKFPKGYGAGGFSMTGVAHSAGDRIVIEEGFRNDTANTTLYTATISYGDGGTGGTAVDLPEDETTTTAGDPWYEFGTAFAFEPVPELRSVGTYLGGAASTTAALAIPTGAGAPQSGDVALAYVYKDNAAAVTPAAGFTEIAAVSCTDHNQHVFWKRLTAADSGTYSFSWTGSVWREGYVVFYRTGTVADTGDPHEALATNFNNTAGTTTPAVTVVPVGNNRRIIHSVTNFTGATTFTPPSNLTERTTASGTRAASVADRVWSDTTTTGAMSGTTNTSGRMTAVAFALKPYVAPVGGFDPRTASGILMMD